MFLDYFAYWAYNLLFVFAIYLIIAKRGFVTKNKKEIIIVLITLLVYSQYRRYGARLFLPNVQYTISNLPIHFCRFSTLMTLVYLITKNPVIKGFVYFQAGLGVFSVLLPGGHFFIMTESWRSYTYMVDHFVLALMPVFLIYIDNYEVKRRDLIISTVYSVVVPLLVLPWALATDYNAYYVLDGVFLRDIVGDNQALILVYMLVSLVLYNFLMYYVGQALKNWSEIRFKNEDNLFSPVYPWYLISGFVVVGVIVGLFFVRPAPSYLEEDTVAYLERPIAVFEEDIIVYAGIGENDEIFYFFEGAEEENVIQVYDADSTYYTPFLAADAKTEFIDVAGIGKTNLLIYYISNDGTPEEAAVVYNIEVINDITVFEEMYQNKLTYND